MSRVTFSSFEEMSLEFSRQSDGSSTVTLREERRVSLETTSDMAHNMMPSSYPNPEQVILAMEAELGRHWDNTPAIRENRFDWMARKLKAAY